MFEKHEKQSYIHSKEGNTQGILSTFQSRSNSNSGLSPNSRKKIVDADINLNYMTNQPD